MEKWAFLGVKPHFGGTWTVYNNLKLGLEPYGIDLRWVVAGKKYASVLSDKNFQNYLEQGEVVCSDIDNEQAVAGELQEHLLRNYKGAIVNVLCDNLCTNLMRYMPSSFPRVMLVHNTTIGTYVAAHSVRDYVYATIGVSYRIQQDLINKYGFCEKKTFYIPNSVQVNCFMNDYSDDQEDLRILVMSRIENKSKGCFRIPEILKGLNNLNLKYECTIAGDGPDLDELKDRCSGLCINFMGRVASEKIPDVINSHDIYLFPSNFEGFGLSLVEAMAGGCVPVASRLNGVTDKIIDDKVSGILVKTNDINGYVSAIKFLADNRSCLREMAHYAHEKTVREFSLESVSTEFNAVLLSTSENNIKKLSRPLKMINWKYPSGLRPGFRTFLPEPVKNKLRLIRELLSNR